VRCNRTGERDGSDYGVSRHAGNRREGPRADLHGITVAILVGEIVPLLLAVVIVLVGRAEEFTDRSQEPLTVDGDDGLDDLARGVVAGTPVEFSEACHTKASSSCGVKRTPATRLFRKINSTRPDAARCRQASLTVILVVPGIVPSIRSGTRMSIRNETAF
jgi:hypothetical protein